MSRAVGILIGTLALISGGCPVLVGIDPAPGPDAVCTPNGVRCSGSDAFQRCADGGLDWLAPISCQAGDQCYEGNCLGICSYSAAAGLPASCDGGVMPALDAVATNWLDSPQIALALVNPGPEEVGYTITYGGTEISAGVIGVGRVAVGATRAVGVAVDGGAPGPAARSGVLVDSKIQYQTTGPVFAQYHQNPDPSTGPATGDATSVSPGWYGHRFRVVALPTSKALGTFMPGSFTVAAREETSLRVSVVADSGVGEGLWPTLSSGESATIDLVAEDRVRQYTHHPEIGWRGQSNTWCGEYVKPQNDCVIQETDLTGSTVEASSPVQLIAAHSGLPIGYDEAFEDLLVEALLPIESWGDSLAFVAPLHPDRAEATTARYRLVVDEDSTITFTPEILPAAVLSGGEYLEFETDQDFVVTSSNSVYGVQYLLSTTAIYPNPGDQNTLGDPSALSGLPTGVWLDDWWLYAVPGWDRQFVAVAAAVGSVVRLDGIEVELANIPGTEFAVARVEVDAGIHHLQAASGSRFGGWVSGYADATSYGLAAPPDAEAILRLPSP